MTHSSPSVGASLGFESGRGPGPRRREGGGPSPGGGTYSGRASGRTSGPGAGFASGGGGAPGGGVGGGCAGGGSSGGEGALAERPPPHPSASSTSSHAPVRTESCACIEIT